MKITKIKDTQKDLKTTRGDKIVHKTVFKILKLIRFIYTSTVIMTNNFTLR